MAFPGSYFISFQVLWQSAIVRNIDSKRQLAGMSLVELDIGGTKITVLRQEFR